MEISKENLINKYSKALDTGSAAVFAGAGISRPAGYVDWKGLLRNAAEQIHLDVDKEKHDLVSLAQYYFNKCNGRGGLNEIIVDEFGGDAKPTKNHELLAKLPIDTFWTTNYDCLIEEALRNVGKKAEIKTKDKQLQISKPNIDAIVYKMHGDIDDVNEAIITRDDYEKYGMTHPLFREVLDGNLLTKTFLFLGFSFTDPNLDYVLGRIRMLLNKSTRPHYCIIKTVSEEDFKVDGELVKEDYQYAQIKQRLQIEDLARFGIQTCLVDEYDEITDILSVLLKRYKRQTVFISGSAEVYEPFTEKQAGLFLHNLASGLVKKGYRIVTGFGKGIGSYVVNGALEYCYDRPEITMDHCIRMMPFPQSESGGISTYELRQKYRNELISDAGISLFVFGNKYEDEKLILAPGVLEEYKLALQNNSIVLPIRWTGYISQELYDSTMENMKSISMEKNYENALIQCGKKSEEVITDKMINSFVNEKQTKEELMNQFI